MKYCLEITREKFDYIDFSEAQIFFHCPPTLAQTITFEAWGVTLLTGSHWRGIRCNLPDFKVPSKDDDTYISGFATIVIEEVVGGHLDVTLYQPNPPYDFLKLQDGELLRLQRSWTYEKSSDPYFYEIHCVLDWPFSDCHLAIAAKGKATLEFNTEDGIPARKYVMHPERYGFKRQNEKKFPDLRTFPSR